MANNRVASNASISRIGSELTRSMQRFSDVQQQIASGKRLQKPSDGPGDVANAMLGRATQRQIEQYTTNATDATGWVRLTDDSLVSVQDNLRSAKDHLVQAVNGALGSASREAIAKDIESTKASLLQLANTTYQGRSIFGGTAAPGAPPYDASGIYSGDIGAVRRTIADGVAVQVNVTGPDVFGTSNVATPLQGDLFQVFDAMAAAVRSGDATAIGTATAALSSAMTRVDIGQTTVGSVTNQIEQTIGRNETMLLDVQDRLSQVEDVDMAEAIVRFKTSENAYQAALGVTAKVIQPSLLDFLR
jgi:flagellar hook-associated protein 3 FlgL